MPFTCDSRSMLEQGLVVTMRARSVRHVAPSAHRIVATLMAETAPASNDSEGCIADSPDSAGEAGSAAAFEGDGQRPGLVRGWAAGQGHRRCPPARGAGADRVPARADPHRRREPAPGLPSTAPAAAPAALPEPTGATSTTTSPGRTAPPTSTTSPPRTAPTTGSRPPDGGTPPATTTPSSPGAPPPAAATPPDPRTGSTATARTTSHRMHPRHPHHARARADPPTTTAASPPPPPAPDPPPF